MQRFDAAVHQHATGKPMPPRERRLDILRRPQAMSHSRRYVLLTACLLVWQQCLAQLQAPVEQPVQIENLTQPGAFEIQAAGSPISLSTRAVIEKYTPSGWVPIADNFLLGEACPSGAPPDCITLAAGAKLRPVRWTGFSCSGQCNHHCKKNVYRGPGTFRLTIFSCDNKTRFHGPAFKLPAATH
jgi:hypothetical protein